MFNIRNSVLVVYVIDSTLEIYCRKVNMPEYFPVSEQHRKKTYHDSDKALRPSWRYSTRFSLLIACSIPEDQLLANLQTVSCTVFECLHIYIECGIGEDG